MKKKMSRICFFVICYLGFVISAVPLQAAYIDGTSGNPDTVDNQLRLDGDLTLNGTLLNLQDTGAVTGGVTLQLDNVMVGSVAHPQLSFIGNATDASQWVWGYDDGASGVTPQMSLDKDNVLTIYDGFGVAAIVLDPNDEAGMTFDGRAILTQEAAEGLFLPVGLSRLAVGEDAVAGGDNAVAFGWDARATGWSSSAFGQETRATGVGSAAFNFGSTASGSYSSAFGSYTQAGGSLSVAFGETTSASGYASAAFGFTSAAEGVFSTAFGNSTMAAGYGQFVIGQYNVSQGTPSVWVATDDLFIVGNGTDNANRSNAFVVKKNGDTHVSGNFSSGTSSANGQFATAFGIWNSAAGYASTAFGEGSYAGGAYSTAFGANTGTGVGAYFSTAFGEGSYAGGAYSTAFGTNARAVGVASTAFGRSTQANAYASVAFGRNNVGFYGSGGDTNWMNSDPILEVGNGGDPGASSNALTLFKNANLRAGGVTESKGGFRTPPQGDLSMGSFTAGNNPADLDPTTGLRYASEVNP